MLLASNGVSLRVDVREAPDPQTDLPIGRFVDLVLVGCGTAVKLRSWEVDKREAGVLADSPSELVAFVASKVEGMLAW